jgi:putative FmdB family regulatory protein
MPIYEYRCPTCQKVEERLQKMGDLPPPCNNRECSMHGKPMEKLVSPSFFELKGSGWAKDGYG